MQDQALITSVHHVVTKWQSRFLKNLVLIKGSNVLSKMMNFLCFIFLLLEMFHYHMLLHGHLWNSEARANFLLDSPDFEYDYRKFLHVQLGLSRTFPINPRVAFFQPPIS